MAWKLSTKSLRMLPCRVVELSQPTATMIGALAMYAGACCAIATASAEDAQPGRNTQPLKPGGWSALVLERAIVAHVNREDYRGRLSPSSLQSLIDHGKRLFRAKFTIHDGAGRPNATQAIIPTKRHRPRAHLFQRLAGSDAGSCASCHNDPVVGGAGDFTVNAFVSEGFSNPDFDTTDPQFSNERNTNHLMGAGLIELLASEMTADLHAIRKEALSQARAGGTAVTRKLVTKGISFGRIKAGPNGILELDEIEGIDPDLVVRPFGHKGVFVSLRQFTVNALNHHHGMQARERFGKRWTGESDFDGDGRNNEITDGDVSALVAWQATLAPPNIVLPSQSTPNSDALGQQINAGSAQFNSLGCNACHVRHLPLRSTIYRDPGPFNTAGTLRQGDVSEPTQYDLAALLWMRKLTRDTKGRVLVPLFGDLKRHVMVDRRISGLGNELLSQRFVGRDEFQTTELWGVGSTAPYGHRGDFTTMDAVIRQHGGEARASRDAYMKATSAQRNQLIRFLRYLVIER